jgi:hypothetical protein
MVRLLRLGLCALAVWSGSGCGDEAPPSPREQLSDVVRSMLRAIPERDAEGILDHVAFDFVAEDGVDYATVQSLVDEFLGREQTYSAELEELQIEPGRTSRELTVHARVRFAPAARPARFARYRFALRFTNLAGTWSARGGRYGRIEP